MIIHSTCPRCGKSDFAICSWYNSLSAANAAGICKVCLLISRKIEVLDSSFCIVYASDLSKNKQDWHWKQISKKYIPYIISIDEIFEYLTSFSKEDIFFTPIDKDPLEIVNDPKFKLKHLANRMK